MWRTWCIWGIARQIDQVKTLTFLFKFKYVVDSYKEITCTTSDFFENFSGSNCIEIVDWALRAVIHTSQIYTVNSLIKNYVQSFICGSTKTKRKKNSIIIIKESTGSRLSFFQ